MNFKLGLSEVQIVKIRITAPHLLLLLFVGILDGNQYSTSAIILGFPFVLAIASAALVVVLSVYAAFYHPVYMQRLLLVCVIIFSMTAYIPKVTSLIEDTAVVELPTILPYKEPDANLRVSSKNDLYIQIVVDQNANIKELNELERERVRNVNFMRKAATTTKVISVAIMVLIFGLLLPYALYLSAHKLAERLKFIETMEIRQAFTVRELKQLVIENTMSVENSMAQLREEIQGQIQQLQEDKTNKALALATSPQDALRKEREQKTKAVLREVEASVRADTSFTYKGLATKYKMDRDTVKKIVTEASKTMPELRRKLDSVKTNS